MAQRSLILLITKSSKITKLILGFSGSIVLVMALFSFFGYALVPYNPNEFVDAPLLPPSSKHLLGTDSLGRDVFSRIVCGTRMSLGIAFLAVAISLILGTSLGALSGYFGGIVDKLLTFVMDSIWILPTIVIAMLIILILGANIINTSFAIAFVTIPRYFRVIRSHTIVIKERGFIEAQRMIGASSFYIIIHHIMPFYTSSLVTLASLGIARAILAVSGLGFLGLGVPPPTPEWGTDLAFGRRYIMAGQWWLTFFPGLMIFIAVMGFNLFSEGLDTVFKSVRASKL